MYISSDSSLGGSAQSLIDMLVVIKQFIEPIVIIPTHGLIEDKLLKYNIKYYIVSFSYGAKKTNGDITKSEDTLNYRDDYEAALNLLPIIERENIQIIHTNTSVTNIGAIAAAIANKAHIWHIRELLEEHFAHRFFNEDIKKELLKSADAIISISDCVSQKYWDKYGIDTIMVYDGLNIERFVLPIKNENKKVVNTFLIVGEINDGKGQADAVKAVDYIVKEEKENVQLILVGNGDKKYIWCLKKYIEKKGLTNHIHIYPFQKDLTKYRRQSEFAITTSKYEALGRTTIEAMLAGNIAIGANTGGTAEIIGTDQKRGFLYQQGDYLDLAKMMLAVIHLSDNAKNEIRKNAQVYVTDEFNVQKYVLKILEIYQSVLNSKVFKLNTNIELSRKLEEMYQNMLNERTVLDKSNLEQKFWSMFLQSNQWLHIRQMGHSIGEILLKDDINTVAIYGMGYLGRSLYDELELDGINIKYVMDKQADDIGEIITVRTLDDALEKVDAIIVTVIEGEDIIIDTLKKKCDFKIIGLSELLNIYEV